MKSAYIELMLRPGEHFAKRSNFIVIADDIETPLNATEGFTPKNLPIPGKLLVFSDCGIRVSSGSSYMI